MEQVKGVCQNQGTAVVFLCYRETRNLIEVFQSDQNTLTGVLVQVQQSSLTSIKKQKNTHENLHPHCTMCFQ